MAYGELPHNTTSNEAQTWAMQYTYERSNVPLVSKRRGISKLVKRLFKTSLPKIVQSLRRLTKLLVANDGQKTKENSLS